MSESISFSAKLEPGILIVCGRCGVSFKSDAEVKAHKCRPELHWPSYERGFRAGAEAMREAAAKACEDLPVWDDYDPNGFAAKLIRALPLPNPPQP